MPLTQHYRVYKGGLPHAVFRTDYLPRLRSLLPSPGGADTSPDDKCGVTPTSVRRPHRLSRPKRLFPDSVAIRAVSIKSASGDLIESYPSAPAAVYHASSLACLRYNPLASPTPAVS